MESSRLFATRRLALIRSSGTRFSILSFTTKGERGTGIGLWISKQLVKKRGGLIAIASSTEAGDSGTSVTIFLPFAIPATLPSKTDEAKAAL
jgi:signal transduction histidine kinase